MLLQKEYQNLLHSSVMMFEEEFSKSFKIKLAVLDSINWLTNVVPYGFTFYSKGWLVIPGDMDYPNFLEIYGAKSFSSKLEQEIKEIGVANDELVDIILNSVLIHELGHYYFNQLTLAESPDRWISEVMASYFSWSYFKEKNLDYLKTLELYSKIFINNYTPKYKTIADFDEVYIRMGIENYMWYHSNFWFLIKDIYEKNGLHFISVYESMFPKKEEGKYSIDEITKIFDHSCAGIVGDWKKEIED